MSESDETRYLRAQLDHYRGMVRKLESECRLKARALDRAWGDITDLQAQLKAAREPECPGVPQVNLTEEE